VTNKEAKEFWREFLARETTISPETPYQVWYFGNTPEMALELAELVISGRKSATASLAAVNELRPDQAPVLGGYSVVTDHHGRPMCIIQTTGIEHCPFDEVDAQFASDEGEGDRSLEYWRSVHRHYYEQEAAELGFDFDERALVCCERFRLLYQR
jgi:uncharacterized protein YhfF